MTDWIEPRLLEQLLVLRDEKSVTRAAERLGITQPAVSANLRRLREAFDDPLFVSQGRRLVATARGLALAADAERVLDGLRNIVRPAVFDPRTANNMVRLALTDYGQALLLPALAKDLERAAPGMRVLSQSLLPSTLEADLASGVADLAVTLRANAPPRLRSLHVFDDQIVTVVRRSHPVATRRFGLDAFLSLDHLVISIAGALTFPADEQLAARGLSRKVKMSVPSFLAAIEIVARTDLALSLPRRIAEQSSLPIRILRHPLPLEPLSIAAVWHDRSDNDPAIRWLRQRLVMLGSAKSKK